tara:strand:- start:335 stop:943 length:609 start_codon:yes stop_codon:yes gene_type:complete
MQSFDPNQVANIASFAAIKVIEKFKAELREELRAEFKKYDDQTLKRLKEVRTALGTQQEPPPQARRYYGSTEPAATLGANRDLYEQTDGANSIIAKWLKEDGKWTKIGDYSNTPGADGTTFLDAVAPAQSPYSTLTGVVNGSNTTFTVPEGDYASKSLTVDRNGMTLRVGFGLTETDAANGIFDLDVAPESGEKIYARYTRA